MPDSASSNIPDEVKSIKDINHEPRVLHLFSRYLDHSMNWAYFLIRNTAVRHTIAAEVFMANKEFLSDDFHFLKTPLQSRIKIFSWLNYRWLRIKLPNELRKQDIVHAHFANQGIKYLSLVRKSGLPMVVSFYGHDYESLLFRKPELRNDFNKLFSEADLFICEGPNGRKILESLGCAISKIRIVPLGIETGKVEYIHRTKKTGQLKLLQLANFREKKGHIYTLKAFAQAIKKCPEMELTLIGDDVDGIRKELQEFAISEGIGRKVLFLDGISYAQVYKTMKHYDVFIQPSCYAENRDCEGGAPVSLLNAQASGMPVISTLHCDIPSVVINGQTGLLSAEKEVAPLAASIETFYKMDAPEYDKFSLNARKHVEQNYDAAASGKLLKDAYASLL